MTPTTGRRRLSPVESTPWTQVGPGEDGPGAGEQRWPGPASDGRACGPECAEAAARRRPGIQGRSLAGEPGSHPLSSHRQNGDACRETRRQGAACNQADTAASRSARHSEGQARQEAPGGWACLGPGVPGGQREGHSLKTNVGVDDDGAPGQNQAALKIHQGA